MSHGFKLIRNGSAVVNILLRPNVAFKSAFLPRNPTLIKTRLYTTRPPIITTTTTRTATAATSPATTTLTTTTTTAASTQVGIIRAQSTLAGSDQHWKNEPHSGHWSRERLVAILTLVTIPASVILEHPVTDYLLGATLVLHGYWGLHGIMIDYIHGARLPKIALTALNVLAIIGFLGLCYFNYYDMGLSKAIKRVWAL